MNKFKIGDKVRVKDFYEIAKTFVGDNAMKSGLHFAKAMLISCGNTYEILDYSNYRVGNYLLENDWFYDESWLELVDLKCTLADVFEYDSELADFFADQIRDEYNIIICDIDHAIFDEDLHENTTYVTKQAKDIILKFDDKHPAVDEWHTHAVIFEGYGYLDCICSSCVADILGRSE